VKAKFVALTVDGRIIGKYVDSETDFLKNPTPCVANGAHGEAWVLSAGGKRLERCELVPDKKSFQASLERGLKGFAALPPSERKPGAVQVPERGPIDPKRVPAVAPPDGALIVRVYNRQLGRKADGELRYTVPEDYIPALRDPKLGVVSNTTATQRYSEPANDMMWVTKADWQAMMPANPRKGQTVKVPLSLCERLFRFQLDPARGLSEGDCFGHVNASAGKLELTVEEVSSNEVGLRLDGFANLHNPRSYLLNYQSPGVKQHSQSQIPLSYQPRLLGYFAYDPAKKVVTRFDMVALGDVRGRPVDENLSGERLGEANPLGIAFELVADPKPADYLSPKGLRDGGDNYNLPRYLCVQNKAR
jgi:hypothetical protein